MSSYRFLLNSVVKTIIALPLETKIISNWYNSFDTAWSSTLLHKYANKNKVRYSGSSF